jgi:hypothetical protein
MNIQGSGEDAVQTTTSEDHSQFGKPATDRRTKAETPIGTVYPNFGLSKETSARTRNDKRDGYSRLLFDELCRKPTETDPKTEQKHEAI